MIKIIECIVQNKMFNVVLFFLNATKQKARSYDLNLEDQTGKSVMFLQLNNF